LYAQNGYVLTIDGGRIEGFLKVQRSFETGELEIELWRNKKDKNPLVYDLYQLQEYGIKKDTFLILTNFYPFEDQPTHFDVLEAKILIRGKIDLLRIDHSYTTSYSTMMGGGLIPAAIDLIMENYDGPIMILNSDSKGLTRVANYKKKEFVNSVNEFFEDDFSLMKKIIAGEYKFKDLKKIVLEYNQ
jgi:hypothetical protein